MNHQKLDKLANTGIVVGCVSGVLCSAALLIEMGRTADKVEWSRRATSGPVAITSTAEENPGEDSSEDALIEEALLEQGYYRDDVPLSYELQDALHTSCTEFSVRYELALGLIEVESRFQPGADNGTCYGLCQLNRNYFPADLSPAENIQAGMAYLGELLERYGNEADALTAYNSGRPGESEYASSVLEAAERWATP